MKLFTCCHVTAGGHTIRWDNGRTSESSTMAAGRHDFSGRLKSEFMFPPIIPIPAAFCRIFLSEKRKKTVSCQRTKNITIQNRAPKFSWRKTGERKRVNKDARM